MSQQLISRSPDLQLLRSEGYDILIMGGYLVLRDVPYATPSRTVALGDLVSELTVSGDRTASPSKHTIWFTGEFPCNERGDPLKGFDNSSTTKDLAPGLTVRHRFSAKPTVGGSYNDYHEKLTTYVALVSSGAAAIDPAVSARTYPVVRDEDETSPHVYLDTASSRAEIALANEKLSHLVIGIVGLGGTGAYVLDLVAKTWVGAIHLWDGDRFLQHNSFRTPGAASVEQLETKPLKVDYLAEVYSRMHRRVIPHGYFLDADTVEEVCEMSFVFIAATDGDMKRRLIAALTSRNVPFIDVGMGLLEQDATLFGTARTVAWSPEGSEAALGEIPYTDGEADDEYARNIQVADINALNAAMAVVKWKKMCEYYVDMHSAHTSCYTIEDHYITNVRGHDET